MLKYLQSFFFRKMVFKISHLLWIIFIIKLSSGRPCEKGKCVAVPMIDELAASLMARLDIRELNKQIGEIIQDTVKQEVENVLNNLVENITDHRVRSAEDKLISKIYNMMELNIRDLNESLEQQSSRLELRVENYNHSLHQKIVKLTQESVEVGLTACVTSETNINKDTIVKFPNIKMSTGMSASDMASFEKSGIFTCRHPGLYYVSMTTDTHTAVTPNLYIFKTGIKVQRMRASSNDHASTGVVVVPIKANDTIYVTVDQRMMLHSNLSCLTIMKN